MYFFNKYLDKLCKAYIIDKVDLVIMLAFNFHSQTIFTSIISFYPHNLFLLGGKEKTVFVFLIKVIYLVKHRYFMRTGQLFGQMPIIRADLKWPQQPRGLKRSPWKLITSWVTHDRLILLPQCFGLRVFNS